MSKVRIINDKTGDVRYVSSYVAEQSELLKQRGYRVEDPKVSFAFEPLKPTGVIDAEWGSVSVINEEKNLIDEFNTEEPVEEIDWRSKYFEVFGRKPGNKSIETMKKEIGENKIVTE